jgi:purine-binding chemotaxis protein CheW
MNDDARDNRISWTQLVTFTLGEESYGIPVGKVKEIIRPVEACPIPGMAGPVEGVINLRGEIIPVLKIHAVLGLKGSGDESRRKQRVIILDSGDGVFGITVDEVREVVKVEDGSIMKSPDVGKGGCSEEAIMGIVQIAGKLVICLNPEKLVSESLDTRMLTGV